MQAAIGAVCLLIGYGIGTLAGYCICRILERSGLAPGNAIRQHGWIVLRVAWLIVVAFGTVQWIDWQNEQRHLMGMAPIVWSDGALMALLSPLAGVLGVIVARVISNWFVAIRELIQRRAPALGTIPATVSLIVMLAVVLGGVGPRAVGAIANLIYAPANEETSEGIVRPHSASVSGSDASLLAWNTLGRMGRDFVATATSPQQLARFHGTDVRFMEPVRVYVGVRSADSVAERTALAIGELERAGGFERKVLVVWIPTGTGWMVPKAATSLELLHRGDTAIVAIQYSFLPSLIGVFVHAGEVNVAGAALFEAVHAHWSKLPMNSRPKLLVFGKSLGAEGIETAFVGVDAASSVANIVARTDGALMAGAARSNVIHAQLTRERDPGSLVRLPVFDQGRAVRFFSRDPDQPFLPADWLAPRIVYLQHGSDPVAFWSIDALWRAPQWMTQPRAFDVPESLRWFPVVSSVQSLGDFLDQLGPPAGFGHDYSTGYVKGWASVVPPEGWRQADTERLERFVETLAGDDSEP